MNAPIYHVYVQGKGYVTEEDYTPTQKDAKPYSQKHAHVVARQLAVQEKRNAGVIERVPDA